MIDLTIRLTDTEGKRLYQQIYEYIRDEIRKGKFLVGEKLPSARSLAEYLQVARSTVDFAYGQLVAEGYVEARPCKGYFVSQVEELFHLPEEKHREQFPQPGNQVFDDRREEELLKREPHGIRYHFSPHGVSLRDFPFATWKKITGNILVDANSEMFALGDAQGDWQLRETIGRYLHSSRGVNCQPEQIIVGAGTDYLLMLLEKILGRHVPVAMEEPTYKRAYKVFESFAYKIEAVPMDGSGMDVGKLKESGARVAYVMPSRQYPTGIVMPIGRRMELLRWAKEEEGRFLIEDDYDSEFRYRGKPIPSLQGSDGEGKVIYMGTFSKSIAPAIRVGYMVLPPRLLSAYKHNCGFYASTVSRIDQKILNVFIREGYFERYLNKMRKIYKGRHDFLLGQLSGFQGAFSISGENAGLHLLLTSKSRLPEQELIDAAARGGGKLYGVLDACMKKDGPAAEGYSGTVLLGYGALEEQELAEGVALLKKAWRAYL